MQSYPFVRGNLAPSGLGAVKERPVQLNDVHIPQSDAGGYTCSAPNGNGNYTCVAAPPAVPPPPGEMPQQGAAPNSAPTPWVVPSTQSDVSVGGFGVGTVPLVTSVLGLAGLAGAVPLLRKRRRGF
jgi:hypothetical protein